MKRNKRENKIKDCLPLYYFHQGTNFNAYEYLGVHKEKRGQKEGFVFRTWAPRADSVSLVGDFNDWKIGECVMNRISDNGVYEIFIENASLFDKYKFAVTKNGKTVFKADPYAFCTETGGTASKIYSLNDYKWGDLTFIQNKKSVYDSPVNIYEVNLASWKKHEDGSCYTYLELANSLVPYVADMGYTHVELMPISEYPFDGSWGYQVTGYYSITSRFGTPEEFMFLVDKFHEFGISVILDWVPAHFPKDEHGLFEFDGTPCYENQGWDRKENKTWGTRLFDLGRNEVQSFLISNAIFLFEKFHIDGLRVDAVAAMLYLDYDKKDGEWIPNELGGNHNLQAISFFKKLNTAVFERFPNALMIAEESTAFPMVTKPVHVGGLGFNFKWNMGWMNDVLSYLKTDPYFRVHEHNKMTFSMFYAFSENFVLPISHDEVVHGKKSLIDKIPGEVTDKFNTLRAFMLYMFAHPGKKLSFMGNEFAQFREWDYKNGLEFFMLKFKLHNKFKEFNKKLNHIYQKTAQLYQIEDSWDGFSWISADEKENNVFSFIRRDKNGKKLLAIFNFSGNDYCNYRCGAEKGNYKLLISSDEKKYGGTGILKRKPFKAVKRGAHGKDYSIKMNLPRLSGSYFIETE